MKTILFLCVLLFGYHTLADDEVDAESLKALEGMENPVQPSVNVKEVEAVTKTLTPDQQEQIQDLAGKLQQNGMMNSHY